MEFLAHLWLPIVASAAAVWVASAVAWMAIGHHHNDWIGLPDEEGFRDYVKSAGIAPGNYGFPHFAGKKDCHTPEGKAKWGSGPVGMLSVWGNISMGPKMLVTFLVYIVVGVLIAYLGHVALGPGATREHAFRVLGTAGVLAYSFAFIPNQVWFGAYPRTIVLNVIDGIVYGLVTGAVMAWLWPVG